MAEPDSDSLEADVEHLRCAERAFDVGDYAALRRIVARLGGPSVPHSPCLQRFAAVTRVDRALPAVLCGCAIGLAAIAWYFLRP
jgi:hypothetical protein